MFKSLLPPNTTKLERALEETAALISDVPVPISRYIDPATCPAGLLPWLAWELSVDWWDENWTEAQKRAAIAASPYVHMKKGTPSAIRQAIKALGYTIKIYTSWQERLAPHAFRVEIGVSSQGINEFLINEINRLVQANKNTRSYLSRLSLVGETHGNLYLGSAIMSGLETTIYPYIPEDLTSYGFVCHAGTEQSVDRICIYPLS
ncbi:phage tail protein I [Oxalobacter paraformigenes]|uniref:Phage tail protein I n=1 Tax=Oxalobacter paraformigenes TaxID=556268 RepID=C3X1Y3_9BURK|nr:phage tail protein I [Oxalobacter paraformigenes]EEO27219.1 phage tail protein I [Oxalobacter paraformigenes]